MKPILPFTVIFCALFPFTVISADEIRWKLQKGDKFELTLMQDSQTESICQTIVQRTGTNIQLDLTWHVAEVREENFLVKQVIDRIRLKLATPTADGSNLVDVDTAEDLDKRVSGATTRTLQDLKLLVGMQANLTMDNLGVITKVDVLETDLEKLRLAGSSSPILKTMTAEGLQELLGHSGFSLPREPIVPDGGWTLNRKVNGPFGELAVKNEIKYWGKVAEDGRQRLKFTSSMQLEQEPQSSVESNPVDPPPSLKALEGSGTYWFDQDLGTFTDSDSRHTLKSSKRFRDLQIDTTVTNHSRLTIRRKTPN